MEGMALTIERTGTFVVNWSGSNARQCGALGTQVLTYKVRIGCDEKHLDAQGFIIDNNHIHTYFVDNYRAVRDFESCERIAAKACRDFKTTLATTGVQPDFIEVMVSGNPAAGLTASWRAPKPSRSPRSKEAPAPRPGMVPIPGTKQMGLNTARALSRRVGR